MKTVILAGGYGTRIRDVADNIPKPMIPIGPYPIIFHIMKLYAKYHHKDFIVCLGYKGQIIKDRLEINIIKLDNYIYQNKIPSIDLLKIDTEGFEFDVLQGVKDNLKKIKAIYFEHHFYNMIIKNYTLSNIHDYLVQNNFKKYFKIKMKFRKSFEYIYINNHLI